MIVMNALDLCYMLIISQKARFVKTVCKIFREKRKFSLCFANFAALW